MHSYALYPHLIKQFHYKMPFTKRIIYLESSKYHHVTEFLNFPCIIIYFHVIMHTHLARLSITSIQWFPPVSGSGFCLFCMAWYRKIRASLKPRLTFSLAEHEHYDDIGIWQQKLLVELKFIQFILHKFWIYGKILENWENLLRLANPG